MGQKLERRTRFATAAAAAHARADSPGVTADVFIVPGTASAAAGKQWRMVDADSDIWTPEEKAFCRRRRTWRASCSLIASLEKILGSETVQTHRAFVRVKKEKKIVP